MRLPLVHVGLYEYKEFLLNLDGVRPIFVRNPLERLRFNGKRSTGKCKSGVVPYSGRFLAPHWMRIVVAQTSPDIAGGRRIRLPEAQSLHWAEREDIEISRWRSQSSGASA
jgi:hypothetical protein